MSLKTKLTLACSGVVLMLFGFSGWISHAQISAHLRQWTALLAGPGNHSTAIAHLQHDGQFLFEKLAVLWFSTAIATCLMLAAVLHHLWRNVVECRFRELIGRIEGMSRGTWTEPRREGPHDEVGGLTDAINQLGDRLSFTVHQFAAASKLSALAILGQRMVRRVVIAREHVLAIGALLEVSRERLEVVPEAALRNLEAAAAVLTAVESEFETEFQKELSRHTVPAPALTAVKANGNGHGSR
jgi:hypothetical protein